MSAPSIAYRLRNLFNNNVLKIIARQDIGVLGYSKLSIVTISEPAESLVKALKKQPFVLIIGRTIIDNYLVLATCHNALDELSSTLYSLLAKHSPQSHCEINECICAYKYDFNIARFADESPSPALKKHYEQSFAAIGDKTDYEIVSHLSKDARKSNRAIGRELELSENAVRKRVAALFKKKLLRIGAVINSDSRVTNRSIFSSQLSVLAAQFDNAIDFLARSRNLHLLLHTSGPANIMFNASFEDGESVQDFTKRLRSFGEIRSMRLLNRTPELFRHEFMLIT